MAAVMNGNKTNTPYFGSIDGFRLLASMGIVLFHLVQVGGFEDLKGNPPWLFSCLQGPVLHASVFFILGGFIYGTKYLNNSGSFSAMTFLRSRFRSLYALHAFTTLWMAILVALTAAPGVDLPKLSLSVAAHLSGFWAFFPFGTYSLNTPSWALSGFFLSYALLGPLLRLVQRCTVRQTVILGIVGIMAPIGLWSGLFAFLQRRELYPFFHYFPPVRLLEFLLGMIIAKWFITHGRPRDAERNGIPWFVDDAALIIIFFCIYCNVRSMDFNRPGLRFFQYHFVMVPLYAGMLFFLARGSGTIGWLLSRPWVRRIGACSFYPYLLHIPFFSFLCFILERYFGYYKLLHAPRTVVLLMAALYMGSVYAWDRRKRIPAKPEESTNRQYRGLIENPVKG